MAQKQTQKQNVRVTVNLAEKKKPRKKRGRYRRMREPKMDVSRLASLQAPRSNVQVIRYEYPVLPQAPPQQAPVSAMVQTLGTVSEPHAQPAVRGQNQNAFGTRNTGAPIPERSAEVVVDTPSELEGLQSATYQRTMEGLKPNPAGILRTSSKDLPFSEQRKIEEEPSKARRPRATINELLEREGYPVTDEGKAQRKANNQKTKDALSLKAQGPPLEATRVDDSPFASAVIATTYPSLSAAEQNDAFLQEQDAMIAKAEEEKKKKEEEKKKKKAMKRA